MVQITGMRGCFPVNRMGPDTLRTRHVATFYDFLIKLAGFPDLRGSGNTIFPVDIQLERAVSVEAQQEGVR
jgi:hypothetical protein